MKPDPALADLDVQGYADLLESRLLAFNQPDEGSKLAAMDIFDRTVMQWTPAHQWWRWFFEGLSPAARIRFQRALGEVFARVQPGSFPLQAFDELAVVAANSAALQAVPAMVRVVADGGEWSRGSMRPLAAVLAALKRLRPGGEAYVEVCRLVDAPGFAPWLAFDAFEVLLRARQEAWAQGWLLLRRKFAEALKLGPPLGAEHPADWFERRMQDLTQRSMAMLSPATIAQGIDALGAALGVRLHDALDPGEPLGMLWTRLACLEDSPFEKRGGDAAQGDWFDPRLAASPACHLARRGDLASDGVPWPERWAAWDQAWAAQSRDWRRRARWQPVEQQLPAHVGELQSLIRSVMGQSGIFAEGAVA